MKFATVRGASRTASSNWIVPFAVSMYATGEYGGETNVSRAVSSGNAGAGAGRIADTSAVGSRRFRISDARRRTAQSRSASAEVSAGLAAVGSSVDRKSTRLNSSHLVISYAV